MNVTVPLKTPPCSVSPAVLFLVLVAFAGVFKPLEAVDRDRYSVDEVVYTRLAKQMSRDLLDYDPRPVAAHLRSHGVFVYPYMDDPLFKHPPLYSALLSLPLRAGVPKAQLVYFSFWISLVLPILVYYWGRRSYGESVGLLAGVMMLLDPLSWIVSLRLTNDGLLALLLGLTLYFFYRSLNERGHWIGFGLCWGLALWTKYTAVLVLPIVILFAATCRPDVLRRSRFYAGIGFALLVFSPWFVWMASVHENLGEVLRNNFGFYRSVDILAGGGWPRIALWTIGFLLFYYGAFRGLVAGWARRWLGSRWVAWGWGGCFVLGALLLPGLRQALGISWAWGRLPPTSIDTAFSPDPWFFAAQLWRLSPLYVLGFAGMTLLPRGREADRFLGIAAGVFLAFVLLLKDYESRYILMASPFLMLLGARWIAVVAERLRAACVRDPRVRVLLWAWGAIVVYALLKTGLVDRLVAFPAARTGFFAY